MRGKHVATFYEDGDHLAIEVAVGVDVVAVHVDVLIGLVKRINDGVNQRDLAREVAVQLEQEVAVLTAERDGEIERLQQARQDAYDSYVAVASENLGLRQQVEHLSTSWGFVSDGGE